jgi:hypothetical protein
MALMAAMVPAALQELKQPRALRRYCPGQRWLNLARTTRAMLYCRC